MAKNKNTDKGSILYYLAIALMLLWAAGFYIFGFAAIIHIILGMAAVLLLISVAYTNKISESNTHNQIQNKL